MWRWFKTSYGHLSYLPSLIPPLLFLVKRTASKEEGGNGPKVLFVLCLHFPKVEAFFLFNFSYSFFCRHFPKVEAFFLFNFSYSFFAAIFRKLRHFFFKHSILLFFWPPSNARPQISPLFFSKRPFPADAFYFC